MLRKEHVVGDRGDLFGFTPRFFQNVQLAPLPQSFQLRFLAARWAASEKARIGSAFPEARVTASWTTLADAPLLLMCGTR
jgi:hypothetical protein